jgi:diguanylate cyclase (GGDEF)-like protein
MKFFEIVEKLFEIRTYRNFEEKNGMLLYKELFRVLNPEDEQQVAELKTISDHLEKILLDERKFSVALDLYNFEIDYYHHHYASEKLAAAYKKSMLLYTILESISTNEDFAITNNFQHLIKHFDLSKELMFKRWNNLYLDILSFLPKEAVNSELKSYLENDLNNLISENEYLTDHYFQYLKDAYIKLEKMYNKCHEQSLTDDLTSLNNRRHLYANYPNLVYLAARQKKPISMVIFDIDNFKKINDTYGHQKGDEVLIIIAETMKNFVRKSDFTIRFGGDEFLILLYDSLTSTAVMIAESIRDSIMRTLFKDNEGNKFHVSISVGITSRSPEKHIAENGDVKQFFEDLVKEADIAMYHAKYHDKGKVIVYHQGLHTIIN